MTLYIPESSTQAAKYHNEDGSTTAILYYLDENGETEFFDRNNEMQYVLGRFYFGDDSVTLVAHSDKREYVFVRIEGQGDGLSSNSLAQGRFCVRKRHNTQFITKPLTVKAVRGVLREKG